MTKSKRLKLKAECPQCGEKIVVAESLIGSRTKCAHCEHRFVLFLDHLAKGNDLSGSKGWYVRSETGEQTGPYTYQQLHDWLNAGRVLPEWQIWLEGWSQWKWADEAFQRLSHSTALASTVTGDQAAEERVIAEKVTGQEVTRERATGEKVTGDKAVETAAVETSNGVGVSELDEADREAESDTGAFLANLTPDGPTTSSAPTAVVTAKGKKKQKEANDGSGANMMPAIRRSLAETAPWALVASVGCGLMSAVALVMAIINGVAASGAETSGPAAIAFWLTALAFLMSLPIVPLWKFHRLALECAENQQLKSLLLAMEAQRALWKTVGFMPLIAIAFAALMFVLSILTSSSWMFGG